MSLVSFADNTSRNRVDPRRSHGGGIRGKIKGFSGASRRNLLRRFASFNRTAFRAYRGRVVCATLTYPREWPDDPDARLAQAPPKEVR